jgi:hypothetical protein
MNYTTIQSNYNIAITKEERVKRREIFGENKIEIQVKDPISLLFEEVNNFYNF